MDIYGLILKVIGSRDELIILLNDLFRDGFTNDLKKHVILVVIKV